MVKRVLTLLLAASILLQLPVCGRAAADGYATTVMIYMCGSNLESGSGAATKDIMEMLKSTYDQDLVKVLVMTGGSTYWYGGFSEKQTAIYDVSGKRPKKVWSADAVSMGEPDTLLSLLDYGYNNCPSERYALVLWDHGGGPVHGCCSDSLFNDGLSLAELNDALSRSHFAEQPLEWIGFDACLMATLEVASAVAPFAKYMVASQESEPGSGWDYGFLKGIEQDSSGRITGKRIVDSYFQSLEGYSGGLTLSCIDLSQISRVSSQVGQLYSNLASDMNADTIPDFSVARSTTSCFGRSADPRADFDLVDLLALSENYKNLENTGVWQVRTALKRAVVYNRSTAGDACGISAYHPYVNLEAFRRDLNTILYSSFSPVGYRRYLYRFATYLLSGSQIAEWQELEMNSTVSTRTESQRFSIRLTEEQQKTFLSAKFMVFAKRVGEDEEQPLGLVYSVADLQPSGTGFLAQRYYGQTMYIVNRETGELELGPVYDAKALSGGKYVLSVYPETSETIGNDLQLWYATNEDGSLQIESIQAFDSVLNAYTPRQNVVFSAYSSLIFPNYTFRPTRDADGVLLGYGAWEPSTGVLQGWEMPNTDWNPEFRTEKLTGIQLYAAFEITDVYNNTFMTELSPVDPSVYAAAE